MSAPVSWIIFFIEDAPTSRAKTTLLTPLESQYLTLSLLLVDAWVLK